VIARVVTLRNGNLNICRLTYLTCALEVPLTCISSERLHTHIFDKISSNRTIVPTAVVPFQLCRASHSFSAQLITTSLTEPVLFVTYSALLTLSTHTHTNTQSLTPLTLTSGLPSLGFSHSHFASLDLPSSTSSNSFSHSLLCHLRQINKSLRMTNRIRLTLT